MSRHTFEELLEAIADGREITFTLKPLGEVVIEPGKVNLTASPKIKSVERHSWDGWGPEVSPRDEFKLPPRNYNYELMFYCSPGQPVGRYDNEVPAEVVSEAERRRIVNAKLIGMMAEDAMKERLQSSDE